MSRWSSRSWRFNLYFFNNNKFNRYACAEPTRWQCVREYAFSYTHATAYLRDRRRNDAAGTYLHLECKRNKEEERERKREIGLKLNRSTDNILWHLWDLDLWIFVEWTETTMLRGARSDLPLNIIRMRVHTMFIIVSRWSILMKHVEWDQVVAIEKYCEPCSLVKKIVPISIWYLFRLHLSLWKYQCMPLDCKIHIRV